jgi:hypothetical protein
MLAVSFEIHGILHCRILRASLARPLAGAVMLFTYMFMVNAVNAVSGNCGVAWVNDL